MRTLTTSDRLPLIAMLLPLALTCCQAPVHQSENLTARAWVLNDSNAKPSGKTRASVGSIHDDYPAPGAFPEHNFDQIKNKRDLGLAFSGGGTSLICSHGDIWDTQSVSVMLPVHEAGIMERFQ
jgi:hypothetical protein